MGLATSAAFVALNHYFKKKRGQAVGLSMAGTALGMMIMPQLVKILLENFGFKGSILMLSGIALNAVVGGMLLQPAKWHMKDEEIDVEMDQLKEMDTIKEDEAEDSLPEIKTLLYNNPRFQDNIKKNFSEINMGTMANRNKGHLPKRPTFPRLQSIQSTSNMSLEVRKRKESVVSKISHMDFTGSNFALHLNVRYAHIISSDYNFIIIIFNCRLVMIMKKNLIPPFAVLILM